MGTGLIVVIVLLAGLLALVGWVAGLAFLVTLVMSIIPSMWAARLNPVEALRFE